MGKWYAKMGTMLLCAVLLYPCWVNCVTSPTLLEEERSQEENNEFGKCVIIVNRTCFLHTVSALPY